MNTPQTHRDLSRDQYLRLAQGDYRTPFVLFTPVLFFHLGLAHFRFHAPIWQIVAGFVFGVFFWGLAEYLLHRFPFHTRFKNPVVRFFTCTFHELHHQIPQSKKFIVSPWFGALIGQFYFLGLFWLILRDWGLVNAIAAGITLGYMYYEWAHYLAHHHTPKSAHYQTLQALHRHHHFKNPKMNFGVSYAFWDHVFGTYFSPKPSSTSALSSAKAES